MKIRLINYGTKNGCDHGSIELLPGQRVRIFATPSKDGSIKPLDIEAEPFYDSTACIVGVPPYTYNGIEVIPDTKMQHSRASRSSGKKTRVIGKRRSKKG